MSLKIRVRFSTHRSMRQRATRQFKSGPQFRPESNLLPDPRMSLPLPYGYLTGIREFKRLALAFVVSACVIMLGFFSRLSWFGQLEPKLMRPPRASAFYSELPYSNSFECDHERV